MKARILLVDDETVLLMSWGLLLEDAGYSVRTALTGKKALELASEERPDIVFTDLLMPDINGIEVCKKMKEINSGIEVVMMTGYPDWNRNFEKEFIEAGGRALQLFKPVTSAQIIETVESIRTSQNND